MKINKIAIISGGWFLMISLFSFYFYNFQVSLPPTFAAAMATLAIPFFLRKKIIVRFSDVKLIPVFYICLVVFGLVMMLDDVDVFVNRFAALPLFAGVAIGSIFLLSQHQSAFSSAIKFVIIIHLIAFYVQTVSYYSGFGYIDYLYSFTGEAQRAFGGSYGINFLGGAFIRPTGLYNEPGTYSTAIMLMFLLYERIKINVVNKNYDSDGFLTVAVILSVLFSFSVFGILFVFVYILNSARNSKLFFIVSFIFLLALVYFIYDIYLWPRFFSGNYADDGTGFRFEVLSKYLDSVYRDPVYFIFGFGFFSDPIKWFDGYVLNDLGLIFSVLLQAGFFGFFIFFICLFGGRGLSKYNISLVIIFGLSKLSLTTMIFWVVFPAIVMFNYSNLYDHKHKL